MKLNEIKNSKNNLKPLYKLERKVNLKPLIIFIIVASVLTFVFTLMFSLIDKLSEQMLEMFKNNEEIYDLFKNSLSTNNLGAYFVLQASQTWGFIGVIYAMFLGCKLVVGNIKDGSYEMIYTLELSRTKILLNKYLRLFINILIFNVIVGIVGFIALAIIGLSQINVWYYLVYFLITVLVCIQAGSLSFGLACLFKKKYSTVLSIVLAVVFYFIANISLMGSNFIAFEYLTPLTALFASVISGGMAELNYISFIIWSIIPLMVVLLGFERFKKTDII